MTPAQLETVEEIFHAALDREPDEVGAFLKTACKGDELLRGKVEALVASHQRAGSFIETSVASLATKIVEQRDLRLGQTIGHYQISKRIGTGGMGEVYLALDLAAGRQAALKLLPPRFTSDAERVKRFQQEARAVVGLNHPNILTVYEIGEADSTYYIASELIDGETLRERLTRGQMESSEAVDVAIQVASALAAAHEAGIVHRDIKPENIMLRPDGYVKVLDFGIAKLQELPVTMATDEALSLAKTNLGSILGTVRYMSPEQARGAPIDKGTDIWSLGVVLYEMITGHAPFRGDTPGEVIASVLQEEPPPLTISTTQCFAELHQIVSKALRKEREKRYQSAHEMLEALKSLRRGMEFKAELERSTAGPSRRRWTRSPTALVLVSLAAALALALPFYWQRNPTPGSIPEKSIAVLPFENRSEDKANAYFADGIQDEILTRLSNIADLKVISRTSTRHYKSAPENLPEIARQLGVAHIVEGSVQKIGDAVRINVRLIKAANDSHLWAATFDRKLTDIFSVESEVAKAIADQLRAHLTSREEQLIVAKPTDNSEAYDAYLRGSAFYLRAHADPQTPADLILKATGFYERAVELDPNFALAWARLSRADAYLYLSRKQDPTLAGRGEAAKHAWEMAQKLAPNSPETLLALGYYQYWALRDFGLAKATFETVSKMLPGSSEVPLALGLIARREGRWDQSIACFEQALALDPRNVELLMRASATYGMIQQHSAQRKLADRLLDITPKDLKPLAMKARTYQAEGDLQEAAKFLVETDEHTPSAVMFEMKITQLQLERNYSEAVRLLQARLNQNDNAEYRVWLAFMKRFAGDTAGAKVTAEESRIMLEALSRDKPDDYDLAALLSQAYAALGEKDAALKAAERAIILLPSVKDAMNGPRMEENLALIQTMVGENSRAISTLSQLLQTPYGLPRITPALLRLDPVWDPLRTDPRFEELVESFAPKLKDGG